MAAEAIGTAFIVIRAVTTRLAKDIQDGIEKGAKDADVESSGRDMGDRMGTAGGESFGDSFDETSSKRVEESADSPEMKKSQKKFSDRFFGRWGAHFSQGADDVSDTFRERLSVGMERSATDIDVDRAAGTFGSDLGDEVGNDFDASFSRNMQHNFKNRSNDDTFGTGFSGFAQRAGKSLADGVGTTFLDSFVGFGDTVAGALNSIKIPGGSIAILAQLAIPALGGALQSIGALAGSATAALGFLGTAAAGAGIGFLGLGAAIAPAFLLIKGAFGVESDELDAFNGQLDDFKEKWESVGLATQETLLPALSASLEMFEALIPTFESYGSVIGQVVGDIAFGAAGILTSTESQLKLSSILANGSQVIRTLGDAGVDLIAPVLTILEAAMPIAQQLADAIHRVVQSFAEWIDMKSKSGELTALFQKWYDRFKLIMSILGNLGSALADVFGIGADSADGMFKTLDAITEKWAEWTNSDEGQAKLTTFFENARKISGEIFGIIGDIGKRLFGGMFDPKGTDGLLGFFKTIREVWIPALFDFGGMIKDQLGPVVGQVFGVITDLVKTLTENPELAGGIIGVLASNFVLLVAALKGLNAVLNTEFVKKWGPLILKILLFAKIGATLWPIVKKIIKVFQGLEAVLGAIFSPIGLVVAAVAALIAGIVLLYFHFQPFRDFVDRNIIDPLQRLWDRIGGFRGIIDFFKELREAFKTGGFGGAVDFLSEQLGNLLDDIKEFFAGLHIDWGGVWDTLFEGAGDIGEQLSEWLQTGIDWLSKNFPKIARTIGKIAGKVLLAIVGVLTLIVRAIGPAMLTLLKSLPRILQTLVEGAFQFLIGILEGLGLPEGIVNFFEGAFGFITDAFQIITDYVTRHIERGIRIVTDIIGFFKALFSGNFGEAFGKIVDIVKTVIEDVIDQLLTFGKLIWFALKNSFSILKDVGSLLLGFGHDLINGLWQGIQRIWDSTILPFFKNLPGNILSAIVSVGNWLLETGKTILNTLWLGIQIVWPIITDFFKNLPGNIVDLVVSVGGWLLETGKTILNTLWLGIQIIWPIITGFFKDLPGNIVDLVVDAGGWLLETGKTILNTLWLGLQLIWPTIRDFFTNLPGAILGLVVDVGGWLLNTGKNILNTLWLGIQAIWPTITNFFTGLPGAIFSLISAAAGLYVDALIGIGSNFINLIWFGVQMIWPTIRDFFTGLPGKILDALGQVADFSGDLLSWGADLISTIIRGITDWIRDNVPGAGWLLDLMGIGDLMSEEDKQSEAIRSTWEHVAAGYVLAGQQAMAGARQDLVDQAGEGSDTVMNAFILGLQDAGTQANFGGIVPSTMINDIVGQLGDIGGPAADALTLEIEEALKGGLTDAEFTDIITSAEKILTDAGTTAAHGFGAGLSNPDAIKALTPAMEAMVDTAWVQTLDGSSFKKTSKNTATTVSKGLAGEITKTKPSTFQSSADAMMTNLSTGLKKAQILLKAFAVGLILTIVSWINPTVKLMQTLGLSMMNGLLQGLLLGLVIVLVAVRTIPTKIVAAIGSVATTLLASGLSLMRGFLAGVNLGAAIVVSALNGMRARFVSAVGNLSGALTSAGLGLMSGLISGVRTGIIALVILLGSLRQTVLNMFAGWGKLLYPTGVSLIQGLIAGIRSQFWALQQAANEARRIATIPAVTGGQQFALGGIVTGPVFATIGEAGAEAVIPLTRPLRALSLLHASGLDELVRQGSPTGGDVTLLNIEHAEINDKVDVDMVAARLTSAYRAMITANGAVA
jgi:hypothetical protein